MDCRARRGQDAEFRAWDIAGPVEVLEDELEVQVEVKDFLGVQEMANDELEVRESDWEWLEAVVQHLVQEVCWAEMELLVHLVDSELEFAEDTPPHCRQMQGGVQQLAVVATKPLEQMEVQESTLKAQGKCVHQTEHALR